jgi:hypothetical protein
MTQAVKWLTERKIEEPHNVAARLEVIHFFEIVQLHIIVVRVCICRKLHFNQQQHKNRILNY